jgi:hypothetical protein
LAGDNTGTASEAVRMSIMPDILEKVGIMKVLAE